MRDQIRLTALRRQAVALQQEYCTSNQVKSVSGKRSALVGVALPMRWFRIGRITLWWLCGQCYNGCGVT